MPQLREDYAFLSFPVWGDAGWEAEGDCPGFPFAGPFTGPAGAYLDAHLACNWVAWKTPSRP